MFRFGGFANGPRMSSAARALNPSEGHPENWSSLNFGRPSYLERKEDNPKCERADSPEQIISAIRAHEAREKTGEVCRRLVIHEQTFLRWRAKYGGMKVLAATLTMFAILECSRPTTNSNGQTLNARCSICGSWVSERYKTQLGSAREDLCLTVGGEYLSV